MMAEWSASSVQPRCFNTDGIVAENISLYC